MFLRVIGLRVASFEADAFVPEGVGAGVAGSGTVVFAPSQGDGDDLAVVDAFATAVNVDFCCFAEPRYAVEGPL